MSLKIARFVGLLTTALALGLTLAHVLELPGQRALDGASWLAVQHTFYGGFAVVGGVSESVAILAMVRMLFLVRRHRVAFLLTLVALGCLLTMLLIFLFGNNPINQQIAVWTPTTLPANWTELRDRWEAAHATSFGFALIAFIALLVAALRDTAPETARATPALSPMQRAVRKGG